ncbi:MAG TPA: DNA-directed RNA polymerase subunit alpha C-terminal domain-containing protein [Candidatus Saccharimonadaceae bacterium]|nr:DNA-directed RNA polymerase subunit alpha C-terminal domain-containing protein [Candidatus Saccharimonadaceae bacterium]
MLLSAELTLPEVTRFVNAMGKLGLTPAAARDTKRLLVYLAALIDQTSDRSAHQLRPNLRTGDDIAKLGFPGAIYNALKRHGIVRIGQLTQHSPRDLLDINTIGQKRLVQIISRLRQVGLALNETDIHGKRRYPGKKSGGPSCPIKRAAFEGNRGGK